MTMMVRLQKCGRKSWREKRKDVFEVVGCIILITLIGVLFYFALTIK